MLSAKAWVRIPRRIHQISLAVACGSAGCLLLGAPRLICQAQNPKVQQGTDLIKQILAKDGLYTRTTTSPNGYKAVMERKFEVTSASGCQLVVASNVHMHTEMSSQNRVTDRTSVDIYHPDFSGLDAASVKVSDPQPAQSTWEAKGYLVRIGVEAGKPPIRASNRIQQTNEEHDLPPLPNLAVYVTSRDQADRLAKAFVEVATACHASPAP
jgi:hypothetical protein